MAVGSVQVGTTIVRFAVLAFMATVGLFYISSANFTPRNVCGESAIGVLLGCRCRASAGVPRCRPGGLERRRDVPQRQV